MSRHRVLPLGGFALLVLFGVLRWGAVLTPAPQTRLLALGLIGLTMAIIGMALAARPFAPLRRALITSVTLLIAVLAAARVAGIPFELISHFRFARIVQQISSGISELPRVDVPYPGTDPWVRRVILLGAAALSLGAGGVILIGERHRGRVPRVLAAGPLLVLSGLPMALVRPAHPYLEGLVLFAGVAALIWGELAGNTSSRRGGGHRAASAAILAGAGALALLVAPALGARRPWIDPKALAGSLASGPVVAFDWTQRYDRLSWPRSGQEIFEVAAPRGDYWKAENLDVLAGPGWAEGGPALASPESSPAPAAQRRWTQPLQVSLRAVSTSQVIGAGFSSAPSGLTRPVIPGDTPGTWIAGGQLGPGDRYTLSSYSPQPSPAQLTAARLPSDQQTLAGYRAMLLPGDGESAGTELLFPPFGSAAPAEEVVGISAIDGRGAVEASPYAPAYALARRLAAASGSPYGYVSAVERYLAQGFRYDERPPPSPLPLISFLFSTHRGYCQQFAGAMALLLRMGGVPARVAVGFTTGTRRRGTHTWVVRDLDAHAWVEAWFSGYGWVRFDPTPSADPALGGSGAAAPPPAARPPGRRSPATPPPARSRLHPPPSASPRASHPRPARGPSAQRALPSAPLPLAVLGLLLAAGLVALVVAGRRREDPEALLAELRRALQRAGRPAASGLTLAGLEHRFRHDAEAAAYIGSLRLSRFAGEPLRVTPRQRRAVRGQLRAGLGPLGAARALWALPPLLSVHRGRPPG